MSAFKGCVHPDDLSRLETTWQGCLKQGVPLDLELSLRRAEGGLYRWHRIHAAPMQDASGGGCIGWW